MKKNIFFLMFALLGLLFQPNQSIAAVAYSTATASQAQAPEISRLPKVQKPKKAAKRPLKNQARRFNTFVFLMVFITVISVGLIVCGVLFNINMLWIAGIVFASVVFLLLIAFIVLTIAGAIAS